jgi:EAL domain-containing protein (putative c-di-GMP-specific phosphodiesterase class I)
MGLMVEVGSWVLRTACLQNVAWQNQGLAKVRVTVNVSSQQLYRGSLVEAVETTLLETGLEPKWLELELTESLAFDDSVTTLRIMQDMKRIGVSLSLDDFGTGWSSFSYLRSFPLDRIKIDRSFMRDITSEPAAEAIVTGILDLGQKLGFDCVAEGVETRQQLDYLRRRKCAEVQGFLYSPALPVAECGALLRSGKLEPMSFTGALGDFLPRRNPSGKVVS